MERASKEQMETKKMNEHLEYLKQWFPQEFVVTGEDNFLKVLGNNFKTVFDVGANIGEWSKLMKKYSPDAVIHAFEVAAPTYLNLVDNVKNLPQVYPNSFGLGSALEQRKLYYAPHYSPISRLDVEITDQAVVESMPAITVPGDLYVKMHNIQYIDLLKIDVEGWEMRVIEGFRKTIVTNKIGIIQFEYNGCNIESRTYLRDFYRYLEPLGFKLGAMYKDRIDLRPYDYTHEVFGVDGVVNYIAVHDSKLVLFGLESIDTTPKIPDFQF